jgi:hypothetical protein
MVTEEMVSRKQACYRGMISLAATTLGSLVDAAVHGQRFSLRREREGRPAAPTTSGFWRPRTDGLLDNFRVLGGRCVARGFRGHRPCGFSSIADRTHKTLPEDFLAGWTAIDNLENRG